MDLAAAASSGYVSGGRRVSNGNGRIDEFNVKRIDEDVFELWHEDEHLATLTREEAWPVMMGQVHPDVIIQEQINESQDKGQ
jgi:hypothetical protein